MIERGGTVVIKMLPDVKQQTIKPVITEAVHPGTLILTDEYDIYSRVTEWGYAHKTVCHSKGE
jgi:transposase